MDASQREMRIKALMAAKDKIEQGIAILNAEDMRELECVKKRMKFGIDLLRQDIMNLQLGVTPYVDFNSEGGAELTDYQKEIIVDSRQMGKTLLIAGKHCGKSAAVNLALAIGKS